jgi:outer membrane protein OmpA-like peptidoglycan-associated protein
MQRIRTFSTFVVAAPLLAIAGCNTGPPPIAVQPPSYVSNLPIVPTYMHAEVIGGSAARLKKARAAGIRPLGVAAVSDYANRLESELRRQTAGTGVDVIRSGDRILLRLPAAFTFDVGSSAIKPQAVSTVSEIGLTVKKFNQTLVDVLGHTDATGTAAANQTLSEKRAQAVAANLRSRGVAQARLATRGHGADYPIGDNVTEAGRALNRRVEIRLVPLR